MTKFTLPDDIIAEYERKEPNWGFRDVYGTPVGEVVFLRTYSRKKDDGTKETWVDVCRRVIEGMFTVQKRHCEENRLPWNEEKAQRTARDAFDRMFNFKWLPPGRGLWMMGTPLVMERRNSAALQNCAFVSTALEDGECISKPFTFLMEASMLGIGVGFDDMGKNNNVHVTAPSKTNPRKIVIEDSREGWVESLRLLINSYTREGAIALEFDYSKIRPAGTPIKTFGGTAAGYEPLKRLHEGVREVLENRVRDTLTGRDIADIGNLIGVCVVSGNVRRSAELLLGEVDDDEFLNLKNYDANPERMSHGWMSNNSVRVTRDTDLSAIEDGVARNGEPGVVWIDTSREYGRLADPKNNKDWRVAGYNPCFHPDTIIETVDGPKRIADITEPTHVYTRGHDGELTVRPASASWISKRNAKTITIGLSNGDELTVTPDHKVMLAGGTWIEAGQLKVNDSLERLHRSRRGWRYSGVRLTSEGHEGQVMEHRMIWEAMNGPIPEGYDIDHINRDHHDNRISNLRMLSHSEHARLSRSQVPNDHQVNGYYEDGRYGFQSGGNGGKKSVEDAITPPRGTNWGNQHTVKYVKDGPVVDVYDLTVEDTHNMIANGVVAHNCAEQSLESYECCTLVETFLDRHESMSDYLQTLKVAYLYAKTVTLLPTHWPETNAVMQRNRRIGTSVSGVTNFLDNNSMTDLRQWLDSGYSEVQRLDDIYSSWLGVRESIKTTTVKPSGTVSLLAGSSPGAHWPVGGHHHLRRVTFSGDDPMVQSFRDAGYTVEDSVYTQGSVVVEFPIESRAKRSEKDVNVWEKAMLAGELQRWWSDNSVSVTVSFDAENEADQIGPILRWASGNLKTVSFLPMGNAVYPQMPYENISDEQWGEVNGRDVFPVDLSLAYGGQAKDAVGEAYCTTDACEMPSAEDGEAAKSINLLGIEVGSNDE